MSPINWLRKECASYSLKPVAIYQAGTQPSWPLRAKNEQELCDALSAGGHFLPLPKEPAALANVIEVSIVDYLLQRFGTVKGAVARRGAERSYPDMEVTGGTFGNGHHAIDIKVARRGKTKKSTQSRITLYTGNTYFKHPTILWPGMFRPFADYASHTDVIALYTFNEASMNHIDDLELLVVEPWKIASMLRSSETREYIGAVKSIADLRAEKGAFATEQDFYKYWRKFRFKVGNAINQQLSKALAGAATP
jgi:hypothetical protein